MTTDALVRAVKSGSAKKIEAAQRRADAQAEKLRMADARARRLAIAQSQVNDDAREAERVEALRVADAGEAALREQGEPFAEIHYGGVTYLVDLSKTEQVSAGTAVEAVRRICLQVKSGWAAQVQVSRHAGSPQPAEPLTAMMGSESGLWHATRLGLVAVRSHALVEEVIEPVMESAK